MIEDMKGGNNGIISNSDPLIPIDFELDIDGIAGIYPGNAFQSTYIPTRYKEMACFQTMGVNQQVSSDGWTSTMKGQVRVSMGIQIDKDKVDGAEDKFEEPKDWAPPKPIELPSLGINLELRRGPAYTPPEMEMVYQPNNPPPPRPEVEVESDDDIGMTDEEMLDMELEVIESTAEMHRDMMDEDYSDMEEPPPYVPPPPPPPLGNLSGNPFPEYQVPIGTPLTWADLGLGGRTGTSNLAELPSQIGVVVNSQSWIPNALQQTVEGFISPALNIAANVAADGQSMIIMINEFAMESGQISETMVGLTNTINSFTNNTNLTANITNQITGLMDDPNNPGVQIYVEFNQGGG